MYSTLVADFRLCLTAAALTSPLLVGPLGVDGEGDLKPFIHHTGLKVGEAASLVPR
jgi:hypothetical protein